MVDVVKGEECGIDGEEFLWEDLWLCNMVCGGGFCRKGVKLLAYHPSFFEG